MRIPAPLLLCLLAVGCQPPAGLTPVPPPGGDDDDDSWEVTLPETGTFAAAMHGQADTSDAPSIVLTKSEGTFQFVYWAEDNSAVPICRQRLPFRAESRFGPLVSASCGGCAGMIEVTEVLPEPADGSEFEDRCAPNLLGAGDLTFLLTGSDEIQGRVADFSRMALVDLDDLLAQDWALTPDGVHVEELIATYAVAGLDATHLAMVRPGGWLGEHGALDEVVTPWGAQGWLPMFVVYRNADRPTDVQWLPGDVFMTSLWHVVLAVPDAPQTPGRDDSSFL